MTTLYKITPRTEWDAAVAAGVYRGAPVDLADGFIHFSTATQVAETAAKHFAGRDDLVLVALAAEPFGDRLRWEPSRGGALFPHLYGRLTMASITVHAPLSRNRDGTVQLPG